MIRNPVLNIMGAMLTALGSTVVVWFGAVALVGQQQAMYDYPTQMMGNFVLGIVVSLALLLYAQYSGGMSLRFFVFDWNSRDWLYIGLMAVVTLGLAAGTMLFFHGVGRHPVTLVAPHLGLLALGWLGQMGVLHEELLFRGYILPQIYRHTQSGWAIVLAALLFMLMHIPFKGAGSMTISWLLGGLLYGYLYFKSGSLMVTWITHVCHNWAMDLLMYSREGVSLFQFAATRLSGMEKIGFALLLTLVLLALTYRVYGHGTSLLAPAVRLPQHWHKLAAAASPRPAPMPS